MKTRIWQMIRPMATAGVLLSMTVGAAAQTTSTDAATETAGSSVSAAPALAPGVEDVVKLAQAQVGDRLILSYVESSPTVYSLDANQVVYLRNAGVSEAVVTAMLDKGKKYSDQAAANTAANTVAQSPATYAAPAQVAYPIVADAQPAQVEAQPVYVEPPAPSVSVYVIPYSATTYDYGYYPYGYYGGGVIYSYYGGHYGYGGYGRYGGFGHRSGSISFRSGYSGSGHGSSRATGSRSHR
jgi:hypothetical protein